MKKDKKVSVIIAAYNEEKTIENMLKSVMGYKYCDEIIVISDGSTDGTLSEVNKIKSSKINLISLKKNKGKGNAIFLGFKKSKNDLILFLDADLVDITHNELDKVVLPVLYNKYDIVFANHKNSMWFYKLLDMDFISGIRCVNKQKFAEFFKKRYKGYSLEVFMNDYSLKKRLRIKNVRVNFGGITKINKFGFFIGWFREFKMTYEIFKEYSFFKTLLQLFKMKKAIKS